MNTNNSTNLHRNLKYSPDQRGQSLIVAIITLFVMLFIGAIFVGLIARNIQNAGRAKDTRSAQMFAEAGVRYVDNILLNSPEGADWRPTPPDVVDPRDPDAIYLGSNDPGKGPYSRIDLGNGRALVRVSYMADPKAGKSIMIESIGRVGRVDPNDPTTFTTTPPRLRRMGTAYVGIGVTDYLRFVTDINNEGKLVAEIGAPNLGFTYPQVYGGITPRLAGSNVPGQSTGAPMRFNGDVRLMGNLAMTAVLNNRGEQILSSGNIILDNGAAPTLYNGNITAPVVASSNANFSSFEGVLRDGNPGTDNAGYSRAITRLEPPTIDGLDPTTNLNRYLTLTRDSGKFLPNTTSLSGRYGMGNGIYIDNASDAEQQTNVQGGQSLRSLWLNPTNGVGGWSGPIYTPPGVILEFGSLLPGEPGFRVVRDDKAFNNPPGNDPSKNPNTMEQDYSFFYYKPADNSAPVLKVDSPFIRAFLKQALNTVDDNVVDAWIAPFNGVIYANGNIRVRGYLPGRADVPVRGPGSGVVTDSNPPSMSLVSGANIYIDGSLIRHSPETMIALMATNCVTVNTTQFLAGNQPDQHMAYVSSNNNAQPPYHLELMPGQQFTLDFIFGDDYQTYTTGGAGKTSPLLLMLRHGSAPGGSFINMLINRTAYQAGGSITYSLANVNQQEIFEQKVFPLLPAPAGNTFTLNGVGNRNIIQLMVDPSGPGGVPSQNYLFSRASIVPMDIRIEAMIYAQNGSFFVIPGLPLNSDPNDTPQQFVANGVRPAGTADEFPFYQQPLDCRITVVGAVSENRTATSSDQAAWMQLWGYIPPYYGSSKIAIPDAHYSGRDVGDAGANPAPVDGSGLPAQGIRFIYDAGLSTPFYNYNTANPAYRRDAFGRTLPAVPRLPVCPGFIYNGDVS